MADDTDVGAGAPDPYVKSLIDQARQKQLMQQLAGQNQGSGIVQNKGEGIANLGKGFANMLQGFSTINQNQNNIAMGNSLAGQSGSTPITGLPPFPSMAPGASTMMPTSGAMTSGISPIAPEYDPQGLGAGLQPKFADRVQDTLQDVGDQGIKATLTSGLRTPQQQDALYAQGRTAPGDRVTNVRGGGSYHNFGAAADVTPEGGGTPDQFAAIGDAGKNLGLTWGGDFRSLRDLDHLQMAGSLANARASQLAGGLGGATPGGLSGATAPPGSQFAPHLGAQGKVSSNDFYNSLIQKGLSPAAAAGITGNATWESGAPRGYVYLDPATDANVKNFGTGDAAVGAIQWEGARKVGVGPDLESQTQHIADELRAGNQGLSLGTLNAVKDPSAAAALVNTAYERPKTPAASMAQRQAYARDVFSGASPSGNQVAGPGAPTPVVRPPGVGVAMSGPNTPMNQIPQGQPYVPNVTRNGQPVAPPGITSPAPIGPPTQFHGPTEMAPTPSPLSPVPLGPNQGLTPPGVAPPATPPPTPPIPPVTPPAVSPLPASAGPPPVAARPSSPIVAPATGGSAYDPKTGRFLAPGEQIPGYAPAPMSSTGGGGGLGGLLSSLLGGGTAQAAPAAGPALASGLGGRPTPALPVVPGPVQRPAVSAAPSAVPTGGAPAGGGEPAPVAAPSAVGGTNPLLPQLSQRYATLDAQYRQAQAVAAQATRTAKYAAGTPYAAAYEQEAARAQKQADEVRSEGDATLKYAQDIQEKEYEKAQERAQPPKTATAGQGIYNPQTGKYDVPIPKEESTPAAIQEYEYAQTHPDYARQPKWVANASVDPLGNPKPGWVYPPTSKEGASGGASAGGQTEPATPELTEDQKKEVGAVPNTYEMPKIGDTQLTKPNIQLTAEQHAALDQVPQERRGMVEAILNNDMELPKVTARNKLGNLLNADVRAVMPGFDAQAQAGRVAGKKEFFTGGTVSMAKQIEFGNTGINHLAEYIPHSEQVDKYVQPEAAGGLITGPYGQLINSLEAGATTEGKGVLDSAHNQALTFAGEFTKYLTGAEGTGAEREAKAATLDGSLPTFSRKLQVLTYLNQIEGRKSEIQAAWHNINGPNVQDFPVNSKESLDNIAKIKQWATTGPGAVDINTMGPAGKSPGNGQAVPAPAAGGVGPSAPSAPVGPAGGPGPSAPAATSGGAFTEPLPTRAIRGGIPGMNQAVAAAQTLLPAGYGGGAPTYQENLSRMLAGQADLNQKHPYVAALGAATPYAGLAGTPPAMAAGGAILPYGATLGGYLARGIGKPLLKGAGFATEMGGIGTADYYAQKLYEKNRGR